MKIIVTIIIIMLSTTILAGESLIQYKNNFEAKRKQFQKSINGAEMQKNADDWNKFTIDELNKFLKDNEKNPAIQELHKKWLVLKNDYWQALDNKYKKAQGSIHSIDHTRAQIELTSNHLQSLIILVD